jgi:hypothetical protein
LSEPLPELKIQSTEEIKLQVYMITGQELSREVSPSHLNTLKQNALAVWLSETRKDNTVLNNFNSEQYDWIIKQLSLSAQRKQ